MFALNDSGKGGGIFVFGGTPEIADCLFDGNSVGGSGGGIYSGVAITVANCSFSGNSASSGGGLYNYASVTAVNCTFTSNTANDGGGIYNGRNSAPKIKNCTFTQNSADNSGGAIYNVYAATTVANCILWLNRATLGPEIYRLSGSMTLRHCSIRGSGGSGTQWNPALGTDGGGNIMANPMFVYAANPAGLDGLWRTRDDGLALLIGSPCIDAGNNADAPPTDIMNLPNPIDGNDDGTASVDMGAYEFRPQPENAARQWFLYH